MMISHNDHERYPARISEFAWVSGWLNYVYAASEWRFRDTDHSIAHTRAGQSSREIEVHFSERLVGRIKIVIGHLDSAEPQMVDIHFDLFEARDFDAASVYNLAISAFRISSSKDSSHKDYSDAKQYILTQMVFLTWRMAQAGNDSGNLQLVFSGPGSWFKMLAKNNDYFAETSRHAEGV